MSDIKFHSEIRLTSRLLVWLEELQQEKCHAPRQKWIEEWPASDVIDHSLIVDPFIAPLGFDIRRRLWSTLNHFWTGQDPRPLESSFRSFLFLRRIFADYVTYWERLFRSEIFRRSVSLKLGWWDGYTARSACRAYAKKTVKNALALPDVTLCMDETAASCYIILLGKLIFVNPTDRQVMVSV